MTSEHTITLSIIIPVLNESENLAGLFQHLQNWSSPTIEILFVDGGSRDDTIKLIEASHFRLIQSEAGRATQMNAGANSARGNWLLFLHADTQLPDKLAPGQQNSFLDILHDTHRRWGRFDVSIDGKSRILPLTALLMNWRSRLTGIATGDQAIFISQKLFARIGQFPRQKLMEDIELCYRLRRIEAPLCLSHKVTTSGRRWNKYGVFKTIVLMWILRFKYWLGYDPDKLANAYPNSD